MLKNLLIQILKLLGLYKKIYNDSNHPIFKMLDTKINDNQIIYFDISSVVLNDQNAGIHRAMKIILQIFTEKYSDRFLIVPIYFYQGFCYCSFTYVQKFNNTKLLNFINEDKCIDGFEPHSIFFSMDINFFLSKSKKILQWFIKQQSQVFSVKIIHDLIPILYPELSEENFSKEFEAELLIDSTYFDKFICVSKATMSDYKNWLMSKNITFNNEISALHWGADIEKYNSHYKNDKQNLEISKYGDYFLMVSTIEPKKGYDAVLKAFNKLWLDGYNRSLIIVGREGFKTRALVKNILNHPLLNQKLFWLNYGVSDLELVTLYKCATAFIMASYTEGFGLGIIEAAKCKTPLILRNIPIFNEIAENNAYYFKRDDSLATDILEWDKLFAEDLHPKSIDLKFLSWEQCCDSLVSLINEEFALCKK